MTITTLKTLLLFTLAYLWDGLPHPSPDWTQLCEWALSNPHLTPNTTATATATPNTTVTIRRGRIAAIFRDLYHRLPESGFETRVRRRFEQRRAETRAMGLEIVLLIDLNKQLKRALGDGRVEWLLFPLGRGERGVPRASVVELQVARERFWEGQDGAAGRKFVRVLTGLMEEGWSVGEGGRRAGEKRSFDGAFGEV